MPDTRTVTVHLETFAVGKLRYPYDFILREDGAVECVLKSNEFHRRIVDVVVEDNVRFNVLKCQVMTCKTVVSYNIFNTFISQCGPLDGITAIVWAPEWKATPPAS